MSGSDEPSTTPVNQNAPAFAIMAAGEDTDPTAVKKARNVTKIVACTLDLLKTPKNKQPEKSDPDQKFNELDFNNKLDLMSGSLTLERKMRILEPNLDTLFVDAIPDVKSKEDSFEFLDKIPRRPYEGPKVKFVEERKSLIQKKTMKEYEPHIISYQSFRLSFVSLSE